MQYSHKTHNYTPLNHCSAIAAGCLCMAVGNVWAKLRTKNYLQMQ